MSRIHIGRKIREVLDKSSLTVVGFAKSINLTRNGAYKVFEKQTIDTGQLQKISKILNHDFFAYYEMTLNVVKESKMEYGYATKDDLNALAHSLQILTKEIEQLRKELPKKKQPVSKYKLSKK